MNGTKYKPIGTVLLWSFFLILMMYLTILLSISLGLISNGFVMKNITFNNGNVIMFMKETQLMITRENQDQHEIRSTYKFHLISGDKSKAYLFFRNRYNRIVVHDLCTLLNITEQGK